MPNTAKALFRGAATTTTTTTLYTVPASTSTVVTDIVVANTAGTAGTFTISLDGVAINSATSIGANESVPLSLKQVLAATKTITGGASAATISFHISGMEIS